MAGWATARIDEIPVVEDSDPGDPAWHPLQHYFGLSTFGINVFVAVQGDEVLVGKHDERQSGQQELYLVLAGEAAFRLDDDGLVAGTGTAVAVTDPTVSREARALAPGTTILVVGAGDGAFRSTWHAEHFVGLERADSTPFA